jgi:hypothetical protein
MSDAEAAANRARTDDPEVGGIAVDRLRSIIERIERLEEERKALANDIKDIYAEAKSAGFRTPPPSVLTGPSQWYATSTLAEIVVLPGQSAWGQYAHLESCAERTGL